jgi:hypothetical protein
MAKVSISEAARQAGITRQYFYKKYIDTGKISVEKDADGKNPQIDTAEFFRVFGKLLVDSQGETQILQVTTPENDSKNAALQTEVQLLREQLTAALEDKKWLQGKVDQLTGQLDTTTRLLEHKPASEPPKKRWWSFS